MLKFLIINPFGIGDVIFSTPLLEALKNRYPDSFIGYVCNKRVSELIKTSPHINRVFIYEKDDFRAAWQRSKADFFRDVWFFLNSIRKEKFDVSVDLTLGYLYSMLLKLLGVKKRLGLNYRNRGRFLTHRSDIEGFDDKHVIQYYFDLLKPLGIDAADRPIRPRIYLEDSSLDWADRFLQEKGLCGEKPVIGMIPGCGASWGQDARYRRWNKEKFAELADVLAERRKAKIILLGDEKEKDLCRDISCMAKSGVINCCGETSLSNLSAIMKRCDLVITNDGGPLHMAVALDVPTVSIFGPVDEKIYGPYPVSEKHEVISAKGISCRPCYRRFKYKRCETTKCLDSIAVCDIAAAAEKLLKSG